MTGIKLSRAHRVLLGGIALVLYSPLNLYADNYLEPVAALLQKAFTYRAPSCSSNDLKDVDQLKKELRAIVDGAIAAGQISKANVVVGTSKSTGPAHLLNESFGSKASASYDLASMTKPIATATAVLKLSEKKMIDLNAPISKYLGDKFSNIELTVADLLSHRGAINDVDGASVKNFKNMSKREALRLATEKVATSTKVRTQKDAQSLYKYRDANYLLLSEIVRRVVNPKGDDPDAFEKYVEREILKPLHMDNTQFNEKVGDGLAHSLHAASGNAGLFSTGADIGQYAQMILNKGAGVLSPESVQRMAVRSHVNAKDQKSFSHAAGFDTDPAMMRPDSFSKNSIGHTGSSGTSLIIDRDQGFFVTFLAVNSMNHDKIKDSNLIMADLRKRVNAKAQEIFLAEAAKKEGRTYCSSVVENMSKKAVDPVGSGSSGFPASGSSVSKGAR